MLGVPLSIGPEGSAVLYDQSAVIELQVFAYEGHGNR